jgi:hypothetical protein
MNSTVETKLRTLINKLRTVDFPGYGQDATVWVRGDYPHMQMEVLPAGQGGLPGTVAVHRFRNLFDDGAKVGAYKAELMAAVPAIAAEVRRAMEEDPQHWHVVHRSRQAAYDQRQREKGFKTIAVRFDSASLSALDRAAAAHGGDRSAAIRALLK